MELLKLGDRKATARIECVVEMQRLKSVAIDRAADLADTCRKGHDRLFDRYRVGDHTDNGYPIIGVRERVVCADCLTPLAGAEVEHCVDGMCARCATDGFGGDAFGPEDNEPVPFDLVIEPGSSVGATFERIRSMF